MMNLSEIVHFITTDIWRIRSKDLPRSKSFLIRQVRIVLLALRGFDENKCFLKASALTFFSLLSIVPVFAMIFGIAKGFGFDKLLEKRLVEGFIGQEDIIYRVIGFARSLLENTKGGVIAGIGVVILFWTVMRVIGNIERSFNDIWGIKKPRSFVRKFSDYLSVVLICPVLVILSSSLTVFITTQVKHITKTIAFLGLLSPLIFFSLKLLPYCTVWALFVFIYIFVPNTKVNFSSGILAGIVAGTIYQIVQWGYIVFQIGMARYNAIYGSFAALPLFLVWLQLSWLILLLGAEISFAHQNVDTYEFEPDCLRVSYSFKRLLSLKIVYVLIKNFSEGKTSYTSTQISHELDIPIRLVRQILFELLESGLVSEVKKEDEKIDAYQPARSIDAYTIKYVIDGLEEHGSNEIPVTKSKGLEKLAACLASFGKEIEKSPANMLLKDI
jgi:membrane protein